MSSDPHVASRTASATDHNDGPEIAEVPSRRKSSAIIAGGSQLIVLASIVRNLVFMPIYLHYIDQAVLGSWIALAGVVSLIGLADCGITNLLMQRSAVLAGGRDFEELGKTIASGLLAIAGLAGTALIIFLPLAAYLTGWLPTSDSRTSEFVLSLRLACLDASLMLMVFGMGSILYGIQRPTAYVGGMIAAQVASMVVTIVLLSSQMGIVSIPLGMLAGTFLVLSVNAIHLRAIVRATLPLGLLRFDIAVLKDLLRSSSLLLASRVSRLTATQTVGLLVALIVGAPQVVVLETTRKAAQLLTDSLGKVLGSIFPGLAHLCGAQKHERFDHIGLLVLRLTFICGLMGAGGVILLNREFVALWVGGQYYGGGALTALICLYVVIQLLNAAAYFIVFAKGFIKPLVIASFCEAVLQIGLSFPFGIFWGLPGIVVAWLFAAGLGFAIQGSWAIRVLATTSHPVGLLPQIPRSAFLGLAPLGCGLIFTSFTVPQGYWQFGLFLAAYGVISVGMIMIDGEIRHLVWSLRDFFRR